MADRTSERGAAGQPASLLYVATVSGTIRHFLAPYSVRLRALGWRVDAAANGAQDDPGLEGAFDHRYELPLSRSILDVGAILRGARAISRTIEEAGPDLVHVHTPIASFLTRLAVRRTVPQRRPLVVYTAHGFHFHHGGRWLTNAVFLTAERVAGRWTDRLIVINDEDELAARRYRIVPEQRLVRMPGIGVDTGWFARSNVPAEASGEERARLGIPPDVPLIVIVGEFSANKRQGDGIAALAAMRHQDARLVLLGDGLMRPALEDRARQLDLVDRVVFAGTVKDVRPILATATALVLNSKREGLARSVMEALALEVPVAASNARGNRELVGDSGFVLEVGDVGGFARALDWLIDHPDERAAMGRRGRDRMRARYDLETVIGLHLDLYREMLDDRTPTKDASRAAERERR